MMVGWLVYSTPDRITGTYKLATLMFQCVSGMFPDTCHLTCDAWPMYPAETPSLGSINLTCPHC